MLVWVRKLSDLNVDAIKVMQFKKSLSFTENKCACCKFKILTYAFLKSDFMLYNDIDKNL